MPDIGFSESPGKPRKLDSRDRSRSRSATSAAARTYLWRLRIERARGGLRGFRRQVERLWVPGASREPVDLGKVLDALVDAELLDEDYIKFAATLTDTSPEAQESLEAQRQRARIWLAEHGLGSLFGGRPRLSQFRVHAAAAFYLGALDASQEIRGSQRSRERAEDSCDVEHIIERFKKRYRLASLSQGQTSPLRDVLRVPSRERALAALEFSFGPYPSRRAVFAYLSANRDWLGKAVAEDGTEGRLYTLGLEVTIRRAVDEIVGRPKP